VDGDCDDDAVAIDYNDYAVSGARFSVRVALSHGGKLSAFEIVEHGWLNFEGLGVNHGFGISLGDVDRDGDADLQLGRAVFLSNGNGFDAETEWAPNGYSLSGWCNNKTCQLFDVDDDGRLDLVEINPNADGHLARVRYALSNGWEFRTDVANYHELDCRDADNECLLGDIDGDRQMDVIDTVRASVGGMSGPGREPGAIWISRGHEPWTEDIGPLKNSGIEALAYNQRCTDLGGGGGVDPF